MRYTVEKVPDIGRHLAHERKIMTDNAPAKAETWAPNEAPTSRWVGFFFACFGAMVVAGVIVAIVQLIWKADGVWSWAPQTVCSLLSFGITLGLAAILVRAICKTTLRQLILGSSGKIDWVVCGKMFGAWIIGMILNALVATFLMPSGGVTTINSIGALPIFVNFLICVVFVWMQTTTEEVMFRCTFLRAVCGDKIRFTSKVVIWGIISSFLFMCMHGGNPEVLTQTTIATIVPAFICYFIAGAGMYFSDVVYGNCLPGCAIHWINNFFLFVFYTEANSAMQSGSLFVSSGSSDGIAGMVGTIVLYIPIFVVLFIDARKKKARKAAA